jgi:hypothetical protein
MSRTYKGRNLDNVFAADPLTERDQRQGVFANGFDAELGALPGEPDGARDPFPGFCKRSYFVRNHS